MVVNLSIKNVPEALAGRLRARAERDHRSLQGARMAIVSAAAEPSAAAGPRRLDQGVRNGTLSIEEVGARMRARFPELDTIGPRAVDIVRADRDGRSR